MLSVGRAGITLRRQRGDNEGHRLAVFPASRCKLVGERERWREAIRGERGQTLILFVFALPLLFALIALVSDGSNLFANKRSVQNVADASVLAAVRELNPCFGSGSVAACTSNVQSVATEYCFRNGGDDATPPCNSVASPPSLLPACNDSSGVDPNSCYKTPYPGSGAYGVQVRIRRDVSLRFGGFLGLTSSPVRAKAAAVLGILDAAANVAPIPISVNKFCSGPGHSGFVLGSPPPDSCFGAPDITVDFNSLDHSKPMLMDLDVISTTGPVLASSVDTATMKSWISIGHAGALPVNAWYAGNSNSGGHGGIQTAFPIGSPMYIPLYDTLDTTGVPPNWYHVIGFAAFVITDVKWTGNTHTLTGHWVRLIDNGSVSSSGGGNDFGVHGVALDE
jgi:Putative Flp pilus-assembly TadE/G-like